MRRSLVHLNRSCLSKPCNFASVSPPIVQIDNGTFYRSYPARKEDDAAVNPPMFAGLTFSLPSLESEQKHWAVIGPSNAGKTTFFEILRGQHLSIPPNARSYPYLSSQETEARHRNPARAIHYVGFDGERGGVRNSGTRGAYLSARYESRRENTDFSVLDYLKGNTDLNPSEAQVDKDIDNASLAKVINDLRLEALIDMPMGNLSNGQTRRARIARALLGKPMILLLDEPFMGLDPHTIASLNPLLHRLAQTSSPRLMLSLRPQDPLPDWISHLIYLRPGLRIAQWGGKEYVAKKMQPELEANPSQIAGSGKSREGLPFHDSNQIAPLGETLVQMYDVCVRYGDKPALGNWKQNVDGVSREGLWWTIRRGERWGVFGPNGSGKTTLLSLICSDHPQAYSLPVQVFGRTRLPRPGQPGISIFDIQSRIGQSSPEIHAFFPRNLSLRQTVQNAWADTFLGTPQLNSGNIIAVEKCLRWFEAELNPVHRSGSYVIICEHPDQRDGHPKPTDWADEIRFGNAPFSAQRVALFLRAIVKKPDLVVLDEAFSGMDQHVRDKCMLFLTWGETRSLSATGSTRLNKHVIDSIKPSFSGSEPFRGLSKDQALICVSHVKDEVPGVVREWMSLPEASSRQPARFGRLHGPLEGIVDGWDQIWGLR